MLLNLGCTALGDQGAEVILQSSERDQVAICLCTDERLKEERWTVRLTNSLLRKSPTSPVVEGPPMFMNTIAVGPLEPVLSWVTGGTTVAMDCCCEAAYFAI